MAEGNLMEGGTMSDDIAIAHKDYDVLGGGERLAEQLAEMFEAPMYVGDRGGRDHDEITINEIDYSPVGEHAAKWAINRGGPIRSLVYQLVWQQQPDLAKYDTIITTGNEPLWYVPTDDQAVVAYTHSPPRHSYDLFQDVESDGVRGLFNICYNYASRVLYTHNALRPDLYVANSDLVARRIRQYWNIPDSQIRVVYPPVETTKYSPDHAETENRYLYLGRLCKEKRVDDLIKTANRNDIPLTVAGTGPDEDDLRDLAGDTVTMRGYVSESEKQRLYARARALIYPPRNEDFGMVPIEAMASGTPVIGVDEGFTQHQIEDGENGMLYRHGELASAIDRFERRGVAWSDSDLEEFAEENFGVEEFRDGMWAAVHQARARARVSVDWETPAADDAELSIDNPRDNRGVFDRDS